MSASERLVGHIAAVTRRTAVSVIEGIETGVREGYYWTPEQDAQLREGVAAGTTDLAIGLALVRTKVAVERRRAKLGILRGQAPGRPWTPEDNARLREMVEANRSNVEIGHALGRTFDAVSSQVIVARLTGWRRKGAKLGHPVARQPAPRRLLTHKRTPPAPPGCAPLPPPGPCVGAVPGHHWLFETPDGPLSQGCCKRCGAQCVGRNAWEGDAGPALSWNKRGLGRL